MRQIVQLQEILRDVGESEALRRAKWEATMELHTRKAVPSIAIPGPTDHHLCWLA